MSTRMWLLIGGVVVVAVVGFLLFRPDTLFTDVETDESLDQAFAATTTTGPAGSSSTRVEPSDTTATAPTEPVQISTGQFVGIDHSATGTANVYEQDGRYVLRFEDDTDIQNGPDLYVLLLPSTSYQGGSPTEYIDLGTLKGTVGSQNYELPADFDPEVHRTVLIWCLRFAVPFAAAPLG
ncbi:MAG TPA: DM13 domain-containing protein [Acidimicrobiia bacterium]|nr:DM13 domain-containing protein [Acidimicrobiia bacterium]